MPPSQCFPFILPFPEPPGISSPAIPYSMQGVPAMPRPPSSLTDIYLLYILVTEPSLYAKNILDALSCLIYNKGCQVGILVGLAGEETEALGS